MITVQVNDLLILFVQARPPTFHTDFRHKQRLATFVNATLNDAHHSTNLIVIPVTGSLVLDAEDPDPLTFSGLFIFCLFYSIIMPLQLILTSRVPLDQKVHATVLGPKACEKK